MQEAFVIYFLTQDPFPMDEVTQNDQHDGPELENPKRVMRWKRVVNKLFKAALEKYEDALAIGELSLDLISHSAVLKGCTNGSDPQGHNSLHLWLQWCGTMDYDDDYSFQGIQYPGWIQQWLLGQKLLYSCRLSSCVSVLQGGPGASE